jgi:hypothetical protein
MLNVAVVGMGGIGNNHAKCYRNNKNVKLCAVCDIVKERADTAAKAYDVPAFYCTLSVSVLPGRRTVGTTIVRRSKFCRRAFPYWVRSQSATKFPRQRRW